MEAFHYRYHPLFARALEVVHGGELGEVPRIETWMCFPLLPKGDIRWDLSLAGGTLMDVGCYAIHQLPPRRRRARGGVGRGQERSPGVDRSPRPSSAIPSGTTGRIQVSMLSPAPARARRAGHGRATACCASPTPPAPQVVPPLLGHAPRRDAAASGSAATPSYLYQLRAFAGAVLRDEPFPTGVDDAIANMRVIDAVYRAAGMEPRTPTA